jgi:hypothetical protein
MLASTGAKLDARASNGQDVDETGRGEEDEEEVDPAFLNLEPENVVYAL